MKPYSVLLTAAALALSACASFNGIQSAAQPRTPADYATNASLSAQGGQWPELSWAAHIGGASLQTLIDEALAHNPGLQVAGARVAAARAIAEAAGAAAGPIAGANFVSTYQRYTEHGIVPPQLAGTYKQDNRLTLDFVYDFDFWGKHAAELRAALSQAKAAEAEQYAARLMLTTSIARTWIQLGRQHAQRDLIDQQLAVRDKIDRLMQLRRGAGLDAQIESEQARQQTAGLMAERAQWQEAVALTRNQLAVLMGQGPDRGLSIARPILPEESATALPAELPLSLLGRRPDIVASRWRVEAAQGDIDSAKTLFYPNVNLVAFVGFSSLGLPNLLDTGSRIAGIGPAIRLPLFESGGLRANLKGKVASYDGAVAVYNQTLTDALREVADQVQSLRATDIQSSHQRIATHAAANGLLLSRQRERAGTANMLPMLANEMNWLVQRRIELDLTTRRAELRIGLIKALGGGFDAAAEGLAPSADTIRPSLPAKRPPLATSAS